MRNSAPLPSDITQICQAIKVMNRAIRVMINGLSSTVLDGLDLSFAQVWGSMPSFLVEISLPFINSRTG